MWIFFGFLCLYRKKVNWIVGWDLGWEIGESVDFCGFLRYWVRYWYKVGIKYQKVWIFLVILKFFSWCVDKLTISDFTKKRCFYSFFHPPYFTSNKITKNKHFFKFCDKTSYFFCCIVFTSSTTKSCWKKQKNKK